MFYELICCTESGRAIDSLFYKLDLDECIIEPYVSMYDFQLISITGPGLIYDGVSVARVQSTNVLITPRDFKNMVIDVAKENDESLYLKIKLLNLDTWGV